MKQVPLVISADLLQQYRTDKSFELLILDIRNKSEYEHNHIPNAIWFDKSQVNRSENETKGLLPAIDDLFVTLQTMPFNGKEHILIYSNTCTPDVGRVAWTLYAYGLNKVSILNGGFNYWQQQQFPISHKPTYAATEKNTFTVDALSIPDSSLSCDYKKIVNLIDDDNTVILDVRSQDEYSGEDKRSKYAGHIPNAININWTETKAENGLFKSDKELHQLFKQHGIMPEHRIITYCQSHQRSALVAILLLHLGYKYTIGYPGAWSDWGNREDTPKMI